MVRARSFHLVGDRVYHPTEYDCGRSNCWAPIARLGSSACSGAGGGDRGGMRRSSWSREGRGDEKKNEGREGIARSHAALHARDEKLRALTPTENLTTTHDGWCAIRQPVVRILCRERHHNLPSASHRFFFFSKAGQPLSAARRLGGRPKIPGPPDP